jgi:esterase
MNVENDEESVPLHVRSQGEGPPLLLLHGLYGSGSNWNGIGRRLAHSYRVHQPDLRNHGKSPHHPTMHYQAMTADLLALMDRLEIGRAAVLGHSMGGKAAMLLALAQPSRVAALAVADVAPVRYRSDEHARLIATLRSLDTRSIGSRAEADEALRAAIPDAGIRQFLLTNLARAHGRWQWRIPLDVLAEGLPAISGWPGELDVHYPDPALFIYGGRSTYVTDDGCVRIRDYFPAARFHCMEECGHLLHVEKPDAFTQVVQRFLSDPESVNNFTQ